MANINSQVKVVNKSKTDILDMYASEQYVIPAGKSRVVPLAAVITWFGDPGAIDTYRVKRRAEEFERIKSRYGGHTEELWNANKPKVEVYDYATNERIYTVIEDPTGAHVRVAPEMSESENLRATIAELHARLERLETVGANDGADVTEDGIDDSGAEDARPLIPVDE